MQTADLFRFLLYCAAGFSAALLFTLLLPLCGCSGTTSVGLQAVQWAQTIFLMILPPVLWTRLHLRRPVLTTLRLDRAPVRGLLCTLCLMIAATPLLEWLAQCNEAMPLPTAVEGVLRAGQAESEALMHLMFDNGNSFGSWVALILLVSVGTAVGEELMFRGAVLNLLLTTRLSRHVVAWLVGFIFSAIHFDPFGFLPRWLLGTLFVYLVYATRSLWAPIVAHAFNNLVALVEYKTDHKFTADFPSWLIVTSALVTALCLYAFFAPGIKQAHSVKHNPQ